MTEETTKHKLTDVTVQRDDLNRITTIRYNEGDGEIFMQYTYHGDTNAVHKHLSTDSGAEEDGVFELVWDENGDLTKMDTDTGEKFEKVGDKILISDKNTNEPQELHASVKVAALDTLSKEASRFKPECALENAIKYANGEVERNPADVMAEETEEEKEFVTEEKEHALTKITYKRDKKGRLRVMRYFWPTEGINTIKYEYQGDTTQVKSFRSANQVSQFKADWDEEGTPIRVESQPDDCVRLVDGEYLLGEERRKLVGFEVDIIKIAMQNQADGLQPEVFTEKLVKWADGPLNG